MKYWEVRTVFGAADTSAGVGWPERGTKDSPGAKAAVEGGALWGMTGSAGSVSFAGDGGGALRV